MFSFEVVMFPTCLFSREMCSSWGESSDGCKKSQPWKVLAMLQVVTSLMVSEGRSARVVRPEERSAVARPQEGVPGKKALGLLTLRRPAEASILPLHRFLCTVQNKGNYFLTGGSF